MKRVFDVTMSLLMLIPALPLMLAAWLAVYLADGGPVIFAQPRVGRHRRLFTCYKIRTMQKNTPSRGSHEVGSNAILPVGQKIRRWKLDELPQLFNVLAGHMSLVGPRPCLPSQQELIELRESAGIFAMIPGITGLAQLRKFDMSTPRELVACEQEYHNSQSLLLDLKLLLATFAGTGLKSDAASKAHTALASTPAPAPQPKPATGRLCLVVGDGFISCALRKRLLHEGWKVRLAKRGPVDQSAAAEVEQFRLPLDYNTLFETELDALFLNVEIVYFLASATPQSLARIEPAERSIAMLANAEMPAWFCRAALHRGAPSFVFVSSCGVHGAQSTATGFVEETAFTAHDEYTRSKIKAETLLRAQGNLPSVCIVRPPMVYGKGMKGPMRHLLGLVRKGVPLPLGAIASNKRSTIGVNNLAAFLMLCASHEAARNETFLVADNKALSTRDFLEQAVEGAGHSARLVPVPKFMLRLPLALIGKSALFDRFLGDYYVNDSKAQRLLGWHAPYSTREELVQMFDEQS